MPEPDGLGGLGSVGKYALWEWSEARGEFVPVHSSITPVTIDRNSVDNHELYAPDAGQGVRVMWLCAQSVAANGDDAVEVTFRYGPNTSSLTDIYKFELVGSQPFPHRAVVDLPADNILYVHLSAARRVLINADVREYVP